jgi:hypothetical protein
MIRLAAVLAVIAMTSACTMSSNGRRATIAGGVATTLAGGLVYSMAPVDADHDGINQNPLDDNLGAYMLGTAMIICGVGMLVGGIAADEVETPKVVVAAAPIQMGPPGYVEPRASLPELPATDEVLKLAQQVRALVTDGHCAAAWATWQRLDAADHAYAIALRDGGAMNACAQQASALSMR